MLTCCKAAVFTDELHKPLNSLRNKDEIQWQVTRFMEFATCVIIFLYIHKLVSFLFIFFFFLAPLSLFLFIGFHWIWLDFIRLLSSLLDLKEERCASESILEFITRNNRWFMKITRCAQQQSSWWSFRNDSLLKTCHHFCARNEHGVSDGRLMNERWNRGSCGRFFGWIFRSVEILWQRNHGHSRNLDVIYTPATAIKTHRRWYRTEGRSDEWHPPLRSLSARHVSANRCRCRWSQDNREMIAIHWRNLDVVSHRFKLREWGQPPGRWLAQLTPVTRPLWLAVLFPSQQPCNKTLTSYYLNQVGFSLKSHGVLVGSSPRELPPTNWDLWFPSALSALDTLTSAKTFPNHNYFLRPNAPQRLPSSAF